MHSSMLRPRRIRRPKLLAKKNFAVPIEKQLNKVEGSHKLSKAVSFGHANEFIQSEKEDQEIWQRVQFRACKLPHSQDFELRVFFRSATAGEPSSA